VDDDLRALELDGAWDFRFDREDAETVSRPLGSWTDLDSHYSGSATYTKSFTVPSGFLADGRRLMLDLGDVRELAAVTVNGRQVGHLDWAPYAVDVTAALQPGSNTVQVTVTNTQANSIQGQAVPSGLLGPVAIRPERVLRVVLTPGTEVTSYDLAVDPAEAVVTPGQPARFTATVSGIGDGDLETVLTTTVPDGWTAQPDEQAVTLHSDGQETRESVEVEVTPPPDAGEGSAEVGFALTGPDGRTVEKTATVQVVESFAAWEFDVDGDAEGWTPANQVSGFTVSGGALRFESTGGDPFVVGPDVSVPLGAGATVEVVMSSSAGGGGQVFWATTDGGFAESRSGRFTVESGGVRTYHVDIPPQGASLTRLRLDPLAGTGSFAVDAIRLLPPTP